MNRKNRWLFILIALSLLLTSTGVASASEPQYAILGYHTVRWGENLGCIGRAYGVDYYAIGAQNGIYNLARIYTGQVLAIPNVRRYYSYGTTCAAQFSVSAIPTYVPPPLPTYVPPPPPPYYNFPPTGGPCRYWYTIRWGDGLRAIAARYGVNMYTLAARNGIANVSRIYAGQVLCIP